VTSDTRRPLSPHLQIYRLPMLPVLSITHRLTGVVLSFAALLLPFFLAAAASGPEAYACVREHLGAWYGQVFLFAVSACLVYHLLNGIRHLVWDTGANLGVRSAEWSGYAVIVLTLLITAAIWFVACSGLYGGAA
jgi:succinate dehydrogenase / fumarate reductase cytochrome b subunit